MLVLCGKQISKILKHVAFMRITLQFPIGKDYQMWRLEAGGCLRNKEHMDRCLGLETHTTGGGVYLQVDEGIDSQKWKYENKYIVNLVRHGNE